MIEIKMISISPIYSTMIVQKLALYCSSYYGNDIYYLKEVVMLLINLYGEENLVEMLKKDNSANKNILRKIGNEWNNINGMKNKLEKISIILEKINKSYSILDDKTLPKKKKDEIKFQEFYKQCKYFPKIEYDFYALFIFLIQNSSIQNMNISQQYLKVLERGNSFGGVNKKTIGEKNEISNL